MKKILFIHHAVGWGGAPKSMIELLKSLDKTKYKAHVLLLKNSVVADKLKENNIEYSIASSTFYKKYYHYFTHSEAGYIRKYQIYRFVKLAILWILSRYYFAKSELRKHDYDIVHLNSSVLTDWLAPAKQKGKTIIHIREPFRNGDIDILHYFFRYQMKKYADHIIAISRDNAQRINIPEKTTVIYNYADVSEKPISQESYSSKKVLYLGGKAKIKGFYTLVKALQFLDEDIKIYFGGSYSLSEKSKNPIKKCVKGIIRYRWKSRKFIQKMRNNTKAIELGMIQNVDKYLDEVCCLVSPFSTPHFARPVIEAHLHHKPAIVSDVRGMKEIVEHNKTGLIVPVGNAKELAKAINYFANHPEMAKVMGDSAAKKAIDKFTPKNIEQFQEIYESI